MGKHTPGPWEITESKRHARDFEPRFVVYSQQYPAGRIAIVSLRGAPNGDRFLHLANAHLIAAAPDLLKALKDVMVWIDNWDPRFTDDDAWDDTNNKVDAAIAKAEG